MHGGKSTGPKTPEGKAKALSKLQPQRASNRRALLEATLIGEKT